MSEQQFLEKEIDVSNSEISEEERFIQGHSPEDKDKYFETTIDSIAEGRKVWMVKEFEPEDHRIYNYFNGGVLAGCIYHDYKNKSYLAWILHTDNDVPLAVYEGDSIIDAKRLVE